MTRVLLLCLAVTAAPLAFGQAFTGPERTWTFDATAVNSLDLENPTGMTRITSEPSRSQIEVHIEKVDWDEELCEVAIAEKDGELKVFIDNSSWFAMTACDADVTVKVPERRNLKLETASGPVRVRGIFDKVELETATATTVLDGEFGDVIGKAGTGTTVIRGLTASVDFVCGSGDVDLHFAKVDPSAQINISTGSGNARVFVPEKEQSKNLKVAMRGATGHLTVLPTSQF